MTLSQVARLAKISRQAVHRALVTERLASTRNERGDYVIAAAEARRFARLLERRRALTADRARDRITALKRRIRNTEV